MSSGGEGWSLFARVAWGIVLGFVILHIGTLLFFGHEKMVDEAGHFAAGSAERALSVMAAARAEPELLSRLSTPAFSMSIEQTPRNPPGRIWPHTDEIGGILEDRLRTIGFSDPEAVRFWYTVRRGGEMSLVMQLPIEDRWLVVEAVGPGVRGHRVMAVFWTTVLGGFILLAVLLATRRFTRVLPGIADAAARVGREAELQELPDRGPREVRRLARAFNAMQARVTELLAERNTMLAALSHDVRTLVTRLSLRMDYLPNETLKHKAQTDVAAITALLDEALAFARDEVEVESSRLVDVPSLLQSLLDDESELGADAAYCGPESVAVQAPPAALRRAFANLIDNAIRYGGGITVTVSEDRTNGRLLVDFEDPGEGIAEADWSDALRPFNRLEPSRSRDTGGSGLGLSISRGIVERCGGELSFEQRPDGFVVRVSLLL